jgi:osmotically-inducible protein OsmY
MKHLVLFLSVLGASLFSGCVSQFNFFSEESQTLSSQYDDAGVKTAVTSALLDKNPTKANYVEVHCFRGHVFLVGEADSEFGRFALELARGTKGVTAATAHWFPAGSAVTSADSALKEIVAEKLRPLTESSLAQIDIDVWGGQVILTGLLPDDRQISRAVSTARSVSGVIGVTSYLLAE